MTSPATTRHVAAMIEGRKADTTRRCQRVLETLNQAAAAGDEITVSGIAHRAGVDRSFLYRHRDLLEQIHAHEAQPPNLPGIGPAVTRASLHTDLLNAQQRCTRLATRVHHLEKRLSEALGDQVWRESGLGAPDDIDQLKQQIIALEQQAVDLQLQMEERTDELAAARAANRELMTRLNAPRQA